VEDPPEVFLSRAPFHQSLTRIDIGEGALQALKGSSIGVGTDIGNNSACISLSKEAKRSFVI